MSNSLASLFVEFRVSLDKFHDDLVSVSKEVRAFDKDLKPVTDRVADFGKLATAAGGALTAGITLPLIGLGVAASAAAIQMDEGMDAIRAGTGATGQALEALGNDFRSVVGTLPSSVGEVATAITALSERTGQSGEALQELARQELNVSRLTNTDLNANIAATTRLFGDWSVSTDKQSTTMDYLFRVSQSTGIGFTRLAELVVQFGAPLRALGFSLDEGAALMGKWEKEGVNLETVLAGLRFALGNFAKAGVDPKVALEGVIEKIQHAKTESEATGIAFQVFGKRAAVDMSRAIIEGRFNIDGLVQSLKNSHETIQKASDDTLSFSDKLKQLQALATKSLAPFGKQIIDALEKMMPLAESALKFIAELASAFAELGPVTQIVVIGILGIAAAIGPLLLLVGQLALGFNGIVQAGGHLAILAGKMGIDLAGIGIGAVASTAGVIALGAAIGVAIGMFVNWILKVTGLQESFDKLLATVVNAIPVIGSWITGQNQVQSATAGTTSAQERLIQRMTELGIAVDRTRIGDSAYIASLANQFKTHNDVKVATDAHGAAVTALRTTTGAATLTAEQFAKILHAGKDKTDEYAKQVSSLEVALRKANVEQKELGDAVAYAEAKHISARVILDAYGGKLKEIIADHNEYGTAINKSLVPYVAMIQQHESMMRVLKMEDEEINKEVDILDAQQKAWLDAEAALRQYNATMAALPLGTAEAARQFETLMDLIDRTNASLANNPIPWKNIPLAPTGIPITIPDIGPAAGPIIQQPDPERWRKWHEEGQRAIDQVVGDMSRMFVDGIVHGKNMWESFKNLGKNAVAGIVDTLMTKMLHSFLDPFATALGKLLDGLTSSLGGILSGLGSKLGGLLGIGKSATGGASSAVGVVTSAVSGSGGSTASSIGGLLSSGGVVGGLISGGLSAAGSLLGSMRLEGTMNAVEHNTRYGYLDQEIIINSFWWPILGHIGVMREEAHIHTTQLDAIFNSLNPGRGGSAAPASGGSPAVPTAAGAPNINININLDATQTDNPIDFGKKVVNVIDDTIMSGRGSYRERWTLAFSQSAGVVSTVPAG